MRLYGVLWVAWLAAFLAIEVSALVTGHPQWTLSDFVWRLEALGRGWTAARYGVAAFLAWLALHLTFGWFR